MAVLAPSWRTSSAAWLPQRRAQRRPASGRWRGRQPATVGRACWRWARSGPWHGLSCSCHRIWRMSAMARNRPWQTCSRTRATPSMCRPAACPPAHEAATACCTTLGGLGTDWTYHRAGGKGREKNKRESSGCGLQMKVHINGCCSRSAK